MRRAHVLLISLLWPLIALPTSNRSSADYVFFEYSSEDEGKNISLPVSDVESEVWLQWSISTFPNDFTDVFNNTETRIKESEPVNLCIRPIVGKGPVFDSWKISYSVTPDYYYYPMQSPCNDKYYDFSRNSTRLSPGTYIYTVTSLNLYQDGYIVGTYYYGNKGYRHILIVEKDENAV